MREFLATNEDRIGTQGKPAKSNITDNQSAKMPSSHGVIQGCSGIATVDEKNQVVVDAQAFGDGHEARHVEKIIDSVDTTFRRLNRKLDIYKEAVVTADSGFHNEAATRGYTGRGYSGYAKHGTGCSLRAKCIRGKKAQVKSITIIDSANAWNQKMIERFDTDRGRHFYSRRMGIVEPVFANVRSNLGLDWFTLRGREKVDTQWKLFCMVHNIGKIAGHWRE